LLYAIIALVALVILAAWLIWRCWTLHVTLTKTQAHLQLMQKEKARRQNLQQVLERREAEIRRLRQRVDDYESDFQEMENRTSDLNMELFRESGLRILAEKEEGANRLKLEQLEQQVSDARKKLRQHSIICTHPARFARLVYPTIPHSRSSFCRSTSHSRLRSTRCS
jgi:DNA repair exonuclease SbcCD ATPase subunit